MLGVQTGTSSSATTFMSLDCSESPVLEISMAAPTSSSPKCRDLNNHSPSPPLELTKHSSQTSKPQISAPYTPSTCLFCPHTSPTTISNLTHMTQKHNFFIPDSDYLIDMTSFLSFLNTIISYDHECLYCGTVRGDRWAVWEHMRSKGHCRIDLEEEGWEEFWDFENDEEIEEDEDEDEGEEEFVDVGEGEIRLSSGKILGHRERKRFFGRENRTPLSVPAPREVRNLQDGEMKEDGEASNADPDDRRLAMRAGTSNSLIGVSDLGQKALRVTERKTLEMEVRAKKRFRAKNEGLKNFQSQKHFRILRRKQRVANAI